MAVPNYLSNLWKLKAIRMFFWMHFFAAVLIPFYTEWANLKLSQVLFINSWFMFWNFVLEVPTGTIADFLGRKISLALGSIAAVIAAAVYISQPEFYTFLAAEFIFAVAYTLLSGADEALAYDSLKACNQEEQSKRILTGIESYKMTGIIIGTIIGGFIAKFGYDAPMRYYMIPAFISFLIALSLKEPPFKENTTERISYITILKEGGGYFLKNKVLLLLTAELTLTNALAWGIIWLFQPLLANAGLSVTYYGFIHAGACLGQIVLLSNVDKMESFIGSKRLLLLYATIITGCSFMLLAFTNYLPLVITGIIFGFTFCVRIPIFSSYMNKYIPSERRATILSLTSMCRTISIVVVNPIIGFLADWSVQYTMLILGALLLISVAFTRIEEKHLIE